MFFYTFSLPVPAVVLKKAKKGLDVLWKMMRWCLQGTLKISPQRHAYHLLMEVTQCPLTIHMHLALETSLT